MIPTEQMYARLRYTLERVAAHRRLPFLAMMSDITVERLEQIVAGAEPTMSEYMTLDNLRTLQ